MQKLWCFKVLLVDDPKQAHELDVKVVNILKIIIYILCKIFGQ